MRIDSAIDTFWIISTSPVPAPMISPTRSPTCVTRGSHFSHATTPRVAQSSAYSSSRRLVRAGIAPRELLMRYVHLSRIGKSERLARSGSMVCMARYFRHADLVPYAVDAAVELYARPPRPHEGRPLRSKSDE